MKIPKGLLKGLTVVIILALFSYLIVKRTIPIFMDAETEDPEMIRRQSEGKTMQQIPVQVSPAFIGDLVIRVSAQGIIRPFREIPIRAQVSGKLEDLQIAEGKYVKQGELLAAVEDWQYQFAYKDAESDLQTAQLNYVINRGDLSVAAIVTDPSGNKRTNEFVQNAIEKWKGAEELFKSNEISEAEFINLKRNYDVALALSGERRDDIVASQAGLTSAQSRFERAKKDLENTRIVAPISGFVANLTVEEGHYIGGSTEICKIIDMNKVRVETGVLEPEIPYIEVGRKAKITLSAFPGEEFTGIVETISPVIENTTCKVTVLVDNPDNKIKPGMFAFVDIDGQIFKDRMLIPKEAVQPRGNRDMFFVVREGRAVWNYLLQAGKRNSDYIEIIEAKEGLKPGEMIVVSGHYTLGHDVPVKIVASLDVNK